MLGREDIWIISACSTNEFHLEKEIFKIKHWFWRFKLVEYLSLSICKIYNAVFHFELDVHILLLKLHHVWVWDHFLLLGLACCFQPLIQTILPLFVLHCFSASFYKNDFASITKIKSKGYFHNKAQRNIISKHQETSTVINEK